MAELDSRIREIADAKRAWRIRRAQLPFPEKIRILVELQKRRAPILLARGEKPRVWNIDFPPASDLGRE